MIVHDPARCVPCGLCVDVCHEGCLALDDGVWRIDRRLCSTCAQCIAICPRRALSWNGAEPVPYESEQLPTAEQLAELFKQRRTMRSFQARPIERELLAQIVAPGIDAPTNNFALRAVVVDDPAVILELERILMRFVRTIHRLMVRPRLVRALIQRLSSAFDDQVIAKIEASVGQPHSDAPSPAAILFVVGDRSVPLSSESAQYALANMMYAAQALGVGACLWGNAQIFVGRHRGARRMLGLSPRERIYAGMMLGYPAVRFRNKVQGKAMPVTWV